MSIRTSGAAAVLAAVSFFLVLSCKGRIGSELPETIEEQSLDGGEPAAEADDEWPDTGEIATGDDGGQQDEGVTADIDHSKDSDYDGLPDWWEVSAGNASLLDPSNPDSDADGMPDGAEDYDSDGLSNLQEYAAGRLDFRGDASPPHPLRRDLLVELDCFENRCLSDEQLARAAEAWAEVPLDNPDGTAGVGLHVVVDQTGLPAFEFDGSFEQRWQVLSQYGPRFDDGQEPPLPLGQFVHVVVAQRRTDIPSRGGDTVAGPEGHPEQAGVFIYHDVIYSLFPACGKPPPDEWPEITPEHMMMETFVHELGHTLQLGHDTDAGGGTNYFNVMSVPQSCSQAQMRSHGIGNRDPELGATEQVGAPRFSRAAAELMDFSKKLSADTALLVPTEM